MMALLDVYLKNEHIERIELQEKALSIGRKQDNGLILHDLTVSRNHARMSFSDAGRFWQMENISSTNPAKLNGEALDRMEILFDGDHIFIGTYTLIFRESDSTDLPAFPEQAVAESQPAPSARSRVEKTRIVAEE